MKKLLRRIYRNKLLYLGVLIFIFAIAGARHFSDMRKAGTLITFDVEKRDMTVSVIEGGNLVALRSQKIINTVPGNRTVLEAIDDGANISEEDIEKGLVLLRLDSSDLEDRKERLTLDVENSWASFMEAEQRLEIQKKQNESDITQAQLKVRFSEMDLKKYLGDELAEGVIERGELDFAALLSSERLGGDALNRKRQLTNNIDIAREQVTRAKDRVNWSVQLAEKGYITQSELEADNLSLRQREVDLERAELEYQLFLNYDFAKSVETHLSNYKESLMEIERVYANCNARLIQAESSLQSRRAAYRLNRNSLEEVERQIESCVIRATQPGFVTTPTGSRWRTQEPIQPGTIVRMNQELFVIPDFRSMGVEVSVHESSVRKLNQGQRATVRVDAFPDASLNGEVIRIAHMPDPTLQFLNPDLNVYITRIALRNSPDYLRPGMSAQVEILIKELKDILAIPIDAVLFRADKPYCIVLQGNNLIEREIEIGESSDTMVEVKRGLSAGETIVMQPRMVASQMRRMELEERGRFEEMPQQPAERMQTPQEVPGTPGMEMPQAPSGAGRREGRR